MHEGDNREEMIEAVRELSTESNRGNEEQPLVRANGITPEVASANGDNKNTPEQGAPAEESDQKRNQVVEIEPGASSDVRFEDLGIPEVLLEGLQSRGYAKPTAVQVATYERAARGEDLIVRSKTGTGKTAAFMLPLLARIPAGERRTKAIVLAPTRELAIQVADEGVALSQYKDVSVVPIYGGVGLAQQAEQLRAGAEVVVGTPGRMLDHIRRHNLDLSETAIVVLDEADEMLSMGFLEEVKSILKHVPEGHQTLLLSATVDATVGQLIRTFMHDPVEIFLSTDVRTVEGIRNILYECSDAYPKARSLLYVLYLESPESAIIFCNTRDDCAFLASYLERQGFEAEPISSDLSQTDRERVMNKIKRNALSFMVATDIAARGIDISDLSHVINYSLPEDPDLYLHRVGRTGRIGKLGTAISLVSGRDLSAELALLRRYNIPFERKSLPTPEEAARLWTEKHLVNLRTAADSTAFEAFVPMVREMKKSLSEEEQDRFFATALRAFFTWFKLNAQGGLENRDERPETAREPSREDRGRRPSRRADEGRGGARGPRRSDSRDHSWRDSGGRSDEGRSSRGGRGGSGRGQDGPRRDGDFSRSARRPRDADGRPPDRDGAPRVGGGRRQEMGPSRSGGGRRPEMGPSRSGGGRRSEGSPRPPRGDQGPPGGQSPELPEGAVLPPDDVLDPLAAFAAENDIDLDAWIDSEDHESGAVSGEPRASLPEDAVPRPEAPREGRRRRRGGRRRRRPNRTTDQGEGATPASEREGAAPDHQAQEGDDRAPTIGQPTREEGPSTSAPESSSGGFSDRPDPQRESED